MNRQGDGRGQGAEGYRGYLLRQRRRAHAEADTDADHAGHHQANDAVAADHPLMIADDPTLITTQSDLDALGAELKRVGRFAYDTEFIGEGSYRPKLCLVQIATADRLAVIDVIPEGHQPGSELRDEDLALNLEPIWRLVANPEVEKVVHAGQPDLEPVVRWIDQPPRSIYDTQIASGLVDTDYPASLRTLADRYLELTLPKALTFTGWDERPLSGAHLRYAADDVRYLLALRAAVGDAVEAAGRTDWAAEEFDRLSIAARYRFDVRQTVARIRRSYRPPRKHDVLLRKLVLWRERLAAARNLPPRAVLRDRVLSEITRRAPESVDDLASVEQLPRWVARDQGRQVISIIASARSHPRWGKARRERPLTRRQQAQVDAWWAEVKRICEAASISLGLVVSRSVFESLARQIVRDKGWPTEHPVLQGWRATLLQPLLTEMAGEG